MILSVYKLEELKSLSRRPHIVPWNWDTDWLLNTWVTNNLLENKNGLYFKGIICGNHNSLEYENQSLNQNMLHSVGNFIAVLFLTYFSSTHSGRHTCKSYIPL